MDNSIISNKRCFFNLTLLILEICLAMWFFAIPLMGAKCPMKASAFTFHGDLHERIQKVTAEIKTRPDSAFLYFKRGKLYFQHEDYSAAIADLDIADSLQYGGTICNLIYAKSYRELHQLEKSLLYIHRILDRDSTNVNALKIKGRVLLEQKKYVTAAYQFESVVEYSKKRLPENYLQAAKAWEAAQLENAPNNALWILQKGIKDLGPLFVFYDEMQALCYRHNKWTAALDIQKQLIRQAKRKERAFYKAAEICLHLQQVEEARLYLNQAQQAIEILPPRLKSSHSIVDLQQSIDTLFQSIE